MKKIIFFLLFASICFSQNNFKFDYLLSYDVVNETVKDSTQSRLIHYLTNSKDNSYMAKIEAKNNDSLNLIFLKQDHIISEVTISKKSFYKENNININCKNVRKFSNPYKKLTNDYDIQKISKIDSLETFQIISLRSEKYKKKKKIGHYEYVFNKNTPFHFPNLFMPTAFEEWKIEKDLPNHFISKISFYNFDNILTETETLLNFSKIDKEINIITEECGEVYIKDLFKN